MNIKKTKKVAQEQRLDNHHKTREKEGQNDSLEKQLDSKEILTSVSELEDSQMDSRMAEFDHSPSEAKEKMFTPLITGLLVVVILVVIFNQIQINSFGGGFLFNSKSDSLSLTGSKDLSVIDLSSLKSTGHTVAAVFPVEKIKTQDDAMAAMFPSGTPDYGQALGVSFEDPVNSLATLAAMYRGLKAEVEKSDPQAWQRFLSLALKPVGISCEYCCGVGPIGINKAGDSTCGCQHNPALLSVALYLTAYTDYTDAEILREVMKWKTLFFPKNMIELGLTVAGGDVSKLELPGMVGGC